MKAKRKVYLLAAGILTTFLLLGCGQPRAPGPAQPNPQPAPAVPSPTPPPPEPATPPVNNPPPPVTEVRRVDVVFFHRTQQCHSCEYAEVQVQKTLEQYFADELASGLVTSQSINMDEANNAAIVKKYAAYSSQLFITTVKGDEEVTEEVLEFWDFIDDDQGFSEFIVNRVNQALASIG